MLWFQSNQSLSTLKDPMKIQLNNQLPLVFLSQGTIDTWKVNREREDGWGGGSGVKRTLTAHPEAPVQLLAPTSSSSQLPVIPALEDPTPSSGFLHTGCL